MTETVAQRKPNAVTFSYSRTKFYLAQLILLET